MNYPEYAEINGKKYKINTDYRNAIECERIGNDKTIGNYERALAIIYILFGDDGLNDKENHIELLEMAQKFLLCGKEPEEKNEKRDMDFIQDFDYIEASFMSDYHIDLQNVNMHWWKFTKLINGLSNSELGNCCILNTIRNLRNYDVSKIQDDKQRNKMWKAQQSVALEKEEKQFTEKEQSSIDKFNELAGL